MYTGIVAGTGTVRQVTEAGDGRRVHIEAEDGIFDGMAVGDSVSVSGVCLTAERVDGDIVEAFLAAETLERSWFDRLAVGDSVNLERPLRPTDTMGGHVVEGHVEDSAEILAIEDLAMGWNLRVATPPALEPYIVEKGFVALEGMSLTVTGVEEAAFTVTIIPETWQNSNLSAKAVGDPVNLEADPVARYVEGMIAEA